MTETAVDFQQADDYDTLLYHNKSEALEAFYQQAEAITIQCEYCIDNDTETVHINEVLRVSEAIKKVLDLAHFSYQVEEEGRYQSYEVQLEYDFTNQAKEHLSDAFGVSGDLL
jgi:hypothetical protein